MARCTFVGEDKKKRLEGSFRFVSDAPDVAALMPKLEKAVKRLRREGEIPPRCEVYVEFIVELADSERGMIADFERWEQNPRRFQHGCITFSDRCPVYPTEQPGPAFRFGMGSPEPVVPATAVGVKPAAKA